MTPGCEYRRSDESMLIGAFGNTSRHMRGSLSTVMLVSSNCQHVIPYTAEYNMPTFNTLVV